MALTFNSREAVQKLLGRGLSEPGADGIVEVVEEATDAVVTADILRAEINVVRAEFSLVRNEFRAEMAEFRADMYRAFWFFGTGIVAALGAIVAVVNALD